MLFSQVDAGEVPIGSVSVLRTTPQPLPTIKSFRQFLESPVSGFNEEVLWLIEKAQMSVEEALGFTFSPVEYTPPSKAEIELCQDIHTMAHEAIPARTSLSTELLEELSQTRIFPEMEKLWYTLAAVSKPRIRLIPSHSPAAVHMGGESSYYIWAPFNVGGICGTSVSATGKNTDNSWKRHTHRVYFRGMFPDLQNLESEQTEIKACTTAMELIKFTLGWRLNLITTLGYAMATSPEKFSLAEFITIMTATAPSKEFLDRYTVYQLCLGVGIATHYAVLMKEELPAAENWDGLADIIRYDDNASFQTALRQMPAEFALVSLPDSQFCYAMPFGVPFYAVVLFLAAYYAKMQSTKELVGSMTAEIAGPRENRAPEFITPKFSPWMLSGEYLDRGVETFSQESPPLPNFPTTLYALKLLHLSVPRLPFFMQTTDYGGLRLIFPTAKATINSLLHAYGAPPNKTVATLPMMTEAFLALADDNHGELLTSSLTDRFQWVAPAPEESLHTKVCYHLKVLNSFTESIYKLMGTPIEDEAKMYHHLNLFRVVDMGCAPQVRLPDFVSAKPEEEEEALEL